MPFIDPETCEPLRVWTRLEPRARQVEFDSVLRAAVHDPLWMLARQWQLGEFQGEDTGSAVLAKLSRRLTAVAAVRAGSGAFEPEDGTLPVEARVERLPIDFPPVVRAKLGRTFLLGLAELAEAQPPPGPAFDAAHYEAAFRGVFPVEAPAAAGDVLVATARDRAGARAGRVALALAGRALDGVALHAALTPGMTAADLPAGLVAAVVPEHLPLVVGALERYRAWFAGLYPPPVAGWDGAALEYTAACTVPRDGGTVALTVAEHVSGRLDWHAFDQGPMLTGAPSASTLDVRTVIPAPAEFAGMPHPRWWQFEDAAVDLASFRADATDIAKIVVAEFALLYGNNWFVVPVPQAVGSLAEIEGVLITDVFGYRTLVEAATPSSGGAWTSWDLFSLAPRGVDDAPTPLPQHLLLTATPGPIQDGAPLETVALVRDESADMVWAVEQRVPDGLGSSQDGTESARRFRVALDALLPPPPPPDPDAPALRWSLGTSVPESWIPFVPVHRPFQTREIRLQRAAMPRFLPSGATPVRPRTSILRPGLAADDTQTAPYFVNEEEVSRAGVVVRGGLRRVRWHDGATVVWYGRTVSSGRGETDSGLRFDAVETRDPRA